MDPDIFDKALEKLWISGGTCWTSPRMSPRGQALWRESYIAHGEQEAGANRPEDPLRREQPMPKCVL